MAWLGKENLFLGGTFPIDVEGHLQISDNEVSAALLSASRNSTAAGHDAARRIIERKHFRVLYERNPSDIVLHSSPGEVIADAAVKKFGQASVRYSKPKIKEVATEFPVKTRDGRIVPAMTVSEVMAKLKPTAIDYVFVNPDLLRDAGQWLVKERSTILEAAKQQQDEEEKK